MYNELYYDTLVKLHRDGIFTNKLDDLVCMDYVTTTARHDVRKTIGGKGKAQVKVSRSTEKFTDNLLTCVGADGYQTPSMVFTHNPIFDPAKWGTAQVNF